MNSSLSEILFWECCFIPLLSRWRLFVSFLTEQVITSWSYASFLSKHFTTQGFICVCWAHYSEDFLCTNSLLFLNKLERKYACIHVLSLQCSESFIDFYSLDLKKKKKVFSAFSLISSELLYSVHDFLIFIGLA